MRHGAITGPLFLIVIGILFLVNNFVADISFSELFRNGWPFLLIGLGFLQLLGGPWSGQGSVTGGLVLITLGALFTLQQWFGISFGRTWPVLLILFGVVGVLRAFSGSTMLAGRAGRFVRGGFR